MDTVFVGAPGGQGAEASVPGRKAAAAVPSAPCSPSGGQREVWPSLGGGDRTGPAV